MVTEKRGPGAPGRRARDLWRDRLLAVSVAVNLAALVVGAVLSTGYVSQRAVLETVEAEAEERRDQTCVLFERDHAAAVERLARTYAYLRTIEGEDLDDAINRAVVRQLPEIELQTRQSTPPPYCDADEVGLPEPNPRLPQRPPDVRLPPGP